MSHSPERFFEEIDVMDKKIDGTNRDQTSRVEPVSACDREKRAGCERQTHCIFDDPAFEMRAAIVRQDNALVAEQLTNGIVHRAARANVFCASKLLFKEAVHLRFRLTACFLVRDSNIFQPPENEDRRDREDRKAESCPPILKKQRNQNADQEQSI